MLAAAETEGIVAVSYFPIDRDILTSSIWIEGTSDQRVVWFYLMISADPRTGIVPDSDPAIAHRCGLALDVVQAALEWLAAPDPHSRTKAHEGRRIERLPEGGIRLLTYTRHRDKDYSTPRVKQWRVRQREKKKRDPRCNGVKRRSTVTETTDTDTNTNPEVKRSPSGDLSIPGREEAAAAAAPPLFQPPPDPGKFRWDRASSNFIGDRTAVKEKIVELGYYREFGKEWVNRTFNAIIDWGITNPADISAKRDFERFVLGWFRRDATKERARRERFDG